MKMRLQRKRNNTPFVYGGIGVVCAVLLLLMLARASVPEPVVEAGHFAARPIWAVQDSLRGAVFGAVAVLDSKQSLYDENSRLYDEVSALRREAFASKLLREENRQLRRLLGRTDNEQGILAAVLARPPITPYDTLVIDAGESEGVVEGDLILIEGGTVLGVVGKALSHSATVSLFSAPGERTPIMIQAGTTSVSAIAEGRGGGGFSARLPRDLAVKVGSPVSLPLSEPLIFAEVEEVSANPADALQEIFFKSPVNTNSLRFVKVVSGESWREITATTEAIETAQDGAGELETTD